MYAFLAQLSSVGDGLTDLLGLFKLDLADVRVRAAQILLIWVMAWVSYRVVAMLAARIVTAADDGDDTRLSYHEKRAQTISQLLRSVGRAVIVVFAVLLTLSLFIDIAALTVSAGVLGLAVSFGAQSLVKDVIAGFFILVENQFTVGDVIEVAGKTGTVESMTLRVVMLRDLYGTLHIVPNGQMATVSNRTRGWSRAVIDVGIGYDSDIDKAIDILRDEARRFEQDEIWRAKFDTAPEVMGVQSLGDNGINIRVLLRTQPGMQWEVAREFRRRVKYRLDKEGIDIPFPQRTVHVRHHGTQPTDENEAAVTNAAVGGA